MSLKKEGNTKNESDSDRDDCTEEELCNTFPKRLSIVTEKALSLSTDYVLHLSTNKLNSPKICAGLSNKICEILVLSDTNMKQITTLDIPDNIINIKFKPQTDLVFIGSEKSIQLWDLRIPAKSVIEFMENDSERDKTFLSFDVSPDNHMLCGSTELCDGDSHIFFWDVRKNKLVRNFCESHTDDITKVNFHPSQNHTIISGSTDGLINVYNLLEKSEEDALESSLNTESTVEQLLWYGNDNICCVTHTGDVQLWNLDDASLLKKFGRIDIAKAIKRKSPDHVYIADLFKRDDDLVLLTGSNWNKGQCVRTLKISDNENLFPDCQLINNKQRLRCSSYNTSDELLITGGEQCIVTVWKESKYEPEKLELKAPKSRKTRKNRMLLK